MAYDRLEPIGDRRFDLLFAQLCWMIYNAARMQGAKADDKTIADFLPLWYVEDEDEDVDASRDLLAAKAAKAFAAFGGKEPRGS